MVDCRAGAGGRDDHSLERRWKVHGVLSTAFVCLAEDIKRDLHEIKLHLGLGLKAVNQGLATPIEAERNFRRWNLRNQQNRVIREMSDSEEEVETDRVHRRRNPVMRKLSDRGRRTQPIAKDFTESDVEFATIQRPPIARQHRYESEMEDRGYIRRLIGSSVAAATGSDLSPYALNLLSRKGILSAWKEDHTMLVLSCKEYLHSEGTDLNSGVDSMTEACKTIPANNSSFVDEFQDIGSTELPSELPPLRDIQLQVDLIPGATLPISYVVMNALEMNSQVPNALVAAYAKCGSLDCARHVFNGLEMKTVSSWNAMIGGCAQNGDPFSAVQLFLQMTSDLGPYLQAPCQQRVLLALVSAMDDFWNPRVQENAATADINFTEYCTPFTLILYLDGLVSKQLVLLQNGKQMVQEGALTALASLAKCSGVEFQNYYDAVMPYLKGILIYAIDKSNRMLRAKFMECISLVGIAVGKDRFRDDAKQVMEVFLSLQRSQKETDDPISSYMLEAWPRLCQCLVLLHHLSEARQLFDEMSSKSVVSWNSIISAYAKEFHTRVISAFQ